MTEGLNVLSDEPDWEVVGATGTSTFNELAPELFERIAEHSDNSTLRALRLTCRDFATKVLRTYGQAHFTSRSLLLSDLDSIRRATNTAEHFVFGCRLRQLVVVVDDVVAQPGCTACQSVSTMSNRTAELTRLFRFFSARSIALQLELVDHKARASEGVRYTPPKCTICQTQGESSTHCIGWDAPWIQILSAVREAGAKLSRMAVTTHEWMLQLSKESILGPSRGLFLDALQNIRALDIRVAALRYGSQDEQCARDFLNMVSGAKTLVTFKVRIAQFTNSNQGVLEYLIFETTMPGIRHFSLTEGTWLSLSELQSFTQRNPNLQKLDLCSTDLGYDNFSNELLDEFECLDQSEVPSLVRRFIDLPGEYNDLWSFEVFDKFERTSVLL
ncbi:hypothetical protein CBER1_10689 [Cercospora berteroae]|uniref:F-box domain-containing protein n=1 Tax=Cercospora berteroae TaxID=357750 RepID=A0A2S6CJM9_9PEZI|nr:hypothetical protein CBER1_10689 [Cercospora berteroae]